MAALIKSIQTWGSTMAAGNAGSTATIAAVNTSMSVIFPRGHLSDNNSAAAMEFPIARMQLASSVLVSCTRGKSDVTINRFFGYVIEFENFVNSIQVGSITVTTATTGGTAAINAVSSRAFIIYHGASILMACSYGSATAGVKLNSSIEVAAVVSPSSVATIVQFAVVDLTSDVVESVQAIDLSVATTSTRDVATINAVDPGRTLIIDGGRATTGGIVGSQIAGNGQGYYPFLAGPTSVTFTRGSSTATQDRRHFANVVQFKAQAFATTVQRNTITSSAATASSTIASVTTLGFVNAPYRQGWCASTVSGLSASFRFDLAAAPSTSVSWTRNSTSSTVATLSFEVVQWTTGITTAAAGSRRISNLDNIECGSRRGLHPIDHGAINITERSL